MVGTVQIWKFSGNTKIPPQTENIYGKMNSAAELFKKSWMEAGGSKKMTMLARFTVMVKLMDIMARSSARFVHHLFQFLHIHRVPCNRRPARQRMHDRRDE